jgi:hypothetical protein
MLSRPSKASAAPMPIRDPHPEHEPYLRGHQYTLRDIEECLQNALGRLLYLVVHSQGEGHAATDDLCKAEVVGEDYYSSFNFYTSNIKGLIDRIEDQLDSLESFI